MIAKSVNKITIRNYGAHMIFTVRALGLLSRPTTYKLHTWSPERPHLSELASCSLRNSRVSANLMGLLSGISASDLANGQQASIRTLGVLVWTGFPGQNPMRDEG